MKNCFKDWSQSSEAVFGLILAILYLSSYEYCPIFFSYNLQVDT